MRQLGSILKTNVRACKAVGHPFVVQLGRIYLDMLNVYKCLSENISSAIQTNGEQQGIKNRTSDITQSNQMDSFEFYVLVWFEKWNPMRSASSLSSSALGFVLCPAL